MAKTDDASVDDYIAAQPLATRPVLERVRATIRKALPGASEGISYQIPVYKLDGTVVLYFAGFERHYSIYPATPGLIRALHNELSGLLHSKATLRFPLAGAVPTRLITRIAKVRAAEATELARVRAARKARPKKAGPNTTGSKKARPTQAAPNTTGPKKAKSKTGKRPTKKRPK